MGDDDARTIHCGNLYADKITEELLYELFVQVKCNSNSQKTCCMCCSQTHAGLSRTVHVF